MFNIYRGSFISWFSWGSSTLVELEFGDVGLCGGRKTGEPREKPSEQGEGREQTQPIYATRPDLNVDHIDGRCHPCFLEERERRDCNLKRLFNDNCVP